MSDWKPGDVAMVTAQWKRGIRDTAPAVLRALGWERIEDGAIAYCGDTLDARPLVVIDPDDAEQVERLRVALNDRSFSAWACGANTVIAAALREFANPTPPKCGVRLDISVDYGEQGYSEVLECQLPEDHDGSHQDDRDAKVTKWGPA